MNELRVDQRNVGSGVQQKVIGSRFADQNRDDNEPASDEVATDRLRRKRDVARESRNSATDDSYNFKAGDITRTISRPFLLKAASCLRRLRLW
jgi:hypothetical protein